MYLGIHATVGLAIAALCAWAFSAIADEFPENGAMARVDLAVTNWLQLHGTERGETIFWWVSLLGAPVLIGTVCVVTGVFVFRRDWRNLAVLATTCAGGAILNAVLKLAFHRERPTFAAEFVTGSWSFPSGHAMDSLIVYGLFSYWIGRAFPTSRVLVRIGATVLVLAIGFARIYLGVHYLSDVLAGYCAGFVWLVVSITAYQFAERRGIGPARAGGS
ncbi:MAG: phosphatase PAP2 family protein [bacterium]